MKKKIAGAMKKKPASRTGNYHSCARKKGCVGLGEGIKGYYACANRTPGSCKKSMVTRRAKAQAIKSVQKKLKTNIKKFKKGSESKTKPGRLDFSTKKGNKDFNRGGKRQKKPQGSNVKRKPYESDLDKAIKRVEKQKKKTKKGLQGLKDSKSGQALFKMFMQGK